MIKDLKAFCQKHQLAALDTSTLIAVSGGIDSVVLCHLFKLLGWTFAIGHCNFKLRGPDSDEDQRFCQELAKQYGVPFYTTTFETETIAKEQKESIQVIARNLRYEWLETIRAENDFTAIATAHHNNDRIETFLYNFTKGTGIRGLRSIPEKNGSIIRPLLFSSKNEILAFAKKHELSHREDRSNASSKYIRNKIRLEAIPVLKSINPNLEKTTGNNFEHLKDLEQIYLWTVEHWRTKVMTKTASSWSIDLEKLNQSPAPSSILYELLQPFGFHSDQINNILSTHKIESGAQFFSANHRLLINRNELIIQTPEKTQIQYLEISEGQKQIQTNTIQLDFHWNTELPTRFLSGNKQAFFDQDKLKFPLVLRPWQQGDNFHPLGMKGQSQKLSDFFTNTKLSIFEKEAVWLLTSGDEICWVVGLRMDERFKISDTTTKVLKISISVT